MAMLSSLVPATAATAKPRGTQSANLGDRPLREGASGPDVKELQRLLTRAGLKVEADGQFGPSTTVALKRFQRATSLEDSGVAGRRTVAALRDSVDVEAPSTSPRGATTARAASGPASRAPWATASPCAAA
jgi:peptidoglycan hydrolase-like protein with peptidoglycan-binding domain